MSKPFMFHFAAKLYTFFYSRNFFFFFFLFTKLFFFFFLEKSKKNFATKAKTFVYML